MNKIRNVIDVIRTEKNWYMDLLDRLKLVKNEYIKFRLKNGINILARSGTFDRNAIREIFIHKTYNPKGFEISKKDIVVDIGAHIGTFSLFASQFANIVYAFEPISDNYKMLTYNIWLNNSKNIIPNQKAVSDSLGKRKIATTSWNTGGHSFYQKGDNYEKVETTTLEKIVKEYKLSRIDFLKMDCEGEEFNILFNAPNRILRKIGKISMECHGVTKRYTIHSMADFLIQKGFTVRCVMNDASTPSGMLYITR